VTLLAVSVIWSVVRADWPSATAFAVTLVFFAWSDMPPRVFLPLVWIGLAAVVVGLLGADLPWWAVLGVLVGTPVLFGATLVVALKRLGGPDPVSGPRAST
jgi:hypothetical protein